MIYLIPLNSKKICLSIWQTESGCWGRQIKHIFTCLSPLGVRVQMAHWKVSSPASCLSCSMDSLLCLGVPPWCSLWSLIYRTHLISDRHCSLQGSAGSLLKALLTKLVIRKCVKWNVCLAVDWNLGDLLSSFREKAAVSSAASRWHSSSLVCKSMS